MRYDVAFTNGVIKSRERDLLGGKIEKMAESTPAEALNILKESGFGGGADCDNPSLSEGLFRTEEERVNDFVREYSTDEKTERFLLADYDFHNAEAFVKSKYFGADEWRIASADGFIPKVTLKECVEKKDYSKLPAALSAAITECAELYKKGEADGFKVDCAFKRQLFVYLKQNAKNLELKRILQDRADSANLSSALRCADDNALKQAFVTGGRVPIEEFIRLRTLGEEEILSGGAFNKKIKQISNSLPSFDERVVSAVREKNNGQPLRTFEKQADDYPVELLGLTRYDMKGAQPFIGYVYTRRAEIKNARIVMVCLNAGLDAKQIKERLRKTK